MAKEGETEVFFITPEVGKCYEHAEATRRTPGVQTKSTRYFTTNQPVYVGKFLKKVIMGSGDGADVYSFFLNDEGKEVRIRSSYEGTTCYREVQCKGSSEGGRKTRKHKRKLKKTRTKSRTRR